MELKINEILSKMTLEEKAGLCSGADFWHTKSVERLGLPRIMMSDGPHGLRKQAEEADHLGLQKSVPAVCFPSGATLASSFDREILNKVGAHLGEEAVSENLHTVLGPAVNIKRSPLCGRNFEYLSEDPYVAGELSASYINGIQDKGAGACIKHYAANNQEYCRMSTDTIAAERTLREIYLPAFETAVKKSMPWSVMCAYNRLNGTYCCENEWLLTDVLRKDWGFKGIVMTDWGAMNDRVKSLVAGLNLEMPASGELNDKKIVKAVKSGELSEEVLDNSVREMLEWIQKGLRDTDTEPYDKEAHHEFSRLCAAESAVLLKNEGNLLPLDKKSRVAFIGDFAENPRFQGGGSSHINCFKVVGACEAAKEMENVSYYQGWIDNGKEHDEKLFNEAVQAAREADSAVIFAGLPESFESEGYDRSHMDLPAEQNALIEAVCAVQPNTVVVLHNGSPVILPWRDKASAILEMYLGGQAVGEAAVDLIFGDNSPSGHLAETFPLRLEDTPCYLSFPGYDDVVSYDEGVFVGYRWYESRKMEVQFPFGHGLTYTEFELSNIELSSDDFDGTGTITVSAELKNIGNKDGKQVVQLYVAPPKELLALRPAKELKGFEKVLLKAGETKKISFTLDERAFAYFSENKGDWAIKSGEYTIELGFSSRDIKAAKAVSVKAAEEFVWTDWVTVKRLNELGFGVSIAEAFSKLGSMLQGGSGGGDEHISETMMVEMLAGMPIHSMKSFIPLDEDYEEKIRASVEKIISEN